MMASWPLLYCITAPIEPKPADLESTLRQRGESEWYGDDTVWAGV